MKRIYTLLALALISGSVAAQTKTEGVTFGVRAGVNLSKIAYSGSDFDSQDGKDIKDAQKSLTSFSFGGYANIPVSGKFSIQPGLSLSGKGSKTEAVKEESSYKLKTSLMYIEVPVNAVFNFDGFYIGAGPYAAYGIAGKNKLEISGEGESINVEEDVKFGSGEEDDFKPFDFGANILAGYKLESGLNFGVNYGLGLANLQSQGTSSNKASNRVISFLVGFSF